VLTENNYADVAYKVITQKGYPGWGYMIKEGATTLWERWEKLEGSGMNSHNHIMLGSVDTWFFKTLVGINSLEPGWKKIKLKPFIPLDLKYASASLNSIKGIIYCSWEKSNELLKINIKIPVGCRSEVWIPIFDRENKIKEGAAIIWENGKIAETVNGVEHKDTKDNFVGFNIGSGYYQFVVQFNK